MQKKFFSNLALMVFLNLLVKPLAIFGIDATVQNQVGAEAYGMYFSLLNFSVLFNILLDFGINNYTIKNVAQSPKAASKYIGKILTFRLVLFFFYAIVSYAIAFTLGWNSYELYLLSFLVLNQFLITLIAFVRSYFAGFFLFKTEAFLGVLDRILLIAICGAALYFPVTAQPFNIEWFIWIQTICYALTLVVAFLLLFIRVGVPRLSFKPAFSFVIIRKSLPYALLILLMMFYSRADSVMLERMHLNGKMQAGYYAQGFRLLAAFFMFATLFSSLLFPMFSRMFKDKTDVLPLMRASAMVLIGGSIYVAVISQFNSNYILGLIYNSDIEASNLSFQLLMWSFIGLSSTVIFGTLLTAKGELQFLNISSAVAILINFGLNYFLIPKYGANGAAFAALITQSLVAIAQFIYCLRLLHLRFSFRIAGQFVLFSAALVGFCYFVRAESLLLFMSILLVGLLFLFAFRLIDLRALAKVMRGREEE